jgi:membrane associated rhomboid family serine protease
VSIPSIPQLPDGSPTAGRTVGQTVKTRGLAALVELRLAAEATILLIGFIWLIQGLNALDGYRLDGEFGLEGRTLSSLPHILTMPFLHVSMEHIEGNTPPLALLTFLAVLGGLRRFLFAAAVIIVAGGLGTWLITSSNTLVVGASGLIFGLIGYLVARGLFARSPWQAVWQIAIGAAVFIYYKWTLVLLYPNGVVNAMHISWQGHLCGLLAGILAAFLGWRSDRRRRADPADLVHRS